MDDWKTDSAITRYSKISEKDYLAKTVPIMTRQLVGRTNRQVVWDKKYRPTNWPPELEWKNPTSAPKDDVKLLRRKYEFLKENVPPDKFSDVQKNCFKLYESGKMDEISKLLFLEKMKEQIEEMVKYKSSINSCDTLVQDKEMEVSALMEKFLEGVNSEASKKRKNTTSTHKSTKKCRVASPCVSLPALSNSVESLFRPIQPKPVLPPDVSIATTIVNLNHSTISTSVPSDQPASTTAASLNHPVIPTSVPSDHPAATTVYLSHPTTSTSVPSNHAAATTVYLSHSTTTTSVPSNHPVATTAASLNHPVIPTSVPSDQPAATTTTGLPPTHETTSSTHRDNPVITCTTTSCELPDSQDITNTQSGHAVIVTDQSHQVHLPSPSLDESSPSADSGVFSPYALSSPEDHHLQGSPQDRDSDLEDFINDLVGQATQEDSEIQDKMKEPDLHDAVVSVLKETTKDCVGT